ncbi:unnamed protein product [Larinioides sclopetarius]|uniref:Ribosomal protein L16 n=1 Tax=Larinioides sclopetarius TaxID=280406 RepID=A0AAV1Z880_9ARAC
MCYIREIMFFYQLKKCWLSVMLEGRKLPLKQLLIFQKGFFFR